MLFNGHTKEYIDSLDENTMNDIVVMYSDGALGNYGIIKILGALTTGIFNYIRSPNTSAYDLKSILGSNYAYMYRDVESNPSDALLTFMTQAQGFSMDKFKKE